NKPTPSRSPSPSRERISLYRLVGRPSIITGYQGAILRQRPPGARRLGPPRRLAPRLGIVRDVMVHLAVAPRVISVLLEHHRQGRYLRGDSATPTCVPVVRTAEARLEISEPLAKETKSQ